MLADNQADTIREARPDDTEAILAIYTPFITGTPVSFEEEPPSLDQMAARIEASHLWLVAEDPSGVTGYAYASPFHPRAAYRWAIEVSVYLHKDAVGRRLGRALLAELLDRMKQRGFVTAFAGVALPNDASIRLFESFGFEKIAHWEKVGFKLGAWHDVAWWQLRMREPSVPPPHLESGAGPS
ncbi:MAG: N-acetyltransferase family protein [Actinobacteria bacterium]|nr:N-acetyltransferase family protein [Actinomycetota bacterium]